MTFCIMCRREFDRYRLSAAGRCPVCEAEQIKREADRFAAWWERRDRENEALLGQAR